MGAVVLIRERLEDVITVTEEALSVGSTQQNGVNLETLGSVRQVHTKLFNNPFKDLEYLKSKGVNPESFTAMHEWYSAAMTCTMHLLEKVETAEQEYKALQKKKMPLFMQLIIKNPHMKEWAEGTEITIYQMMQWSTFGSKRAYGGFQGLFDKISSTIHGEEYSTNILVIQQELYEPIKEVITGTSKEFLQEPVRFEPAVQIAQEL